MARTDIFIILMIMVGVSHAQTGKSETSANPSSTPTATLVNAATAIPAPSASDSSTIEAPPAAEKNDTISSCILIEFKPNITLDYKTASIVIKQDADTSKSCNETTQSWTIRWGTLSNMTFRFDANFTNKTYMLSTIDLNLESDADQTIRNFAYEFKGHLQEPIPIGNSYCWNVREALPFVRKNSDVNEAINVTITSDVKMEAFRKGGNDKFSSSLHCDSAPITPNPPTSDTSSVVVISVICCLLGVIVVTFIGYFIDRWRMDGSSNLFSTCSRA